MLWVNFGRWYSKSTSMFIWERVYKNGWHWTPFVMARRRYGRQKPEVQVDE